MIVKGHKNRKTERMKRRDKESEKAKKERVIIENLNHMIRINRSH